MLTMSSELPSATAEPAPIAAEPPGLVELFFVFAKMSLAGFGGVLFWARRTIVEQRRWMNPDEFNETFALCHFLPGPNIVNLSVVFGSRFRGIPGSIAAFIGLLGPPMIVVTVLAALYVRFGGTDTLQRTLHGISCAAIGLFFAAMVRMVIPLVQQRRIAALPIIVLIFAAIGLLRWPLPYVLLVAIPASIALIYWLRRRTA
jgi:chromate transporter